MGKVNACSRGNALTVVMLTVLIVTLLAVTVLYVTVNGRGLTANYKNYSGVYDMALAGNEHALSLFEAAAGQTDETESNPREGIADAFEDALVDDGFEEIMPGEFKKNWSAEIITDISEVFSCVTTVRRDENNFTVTTSAAKTLDGLVSYPATVQLDIEWPPSALNSFDGSERPMLKSKRI